MAQAPLSDTTFANAETVPTPYQDIQAPAAAFGGPIGQGLSELGQSAENVAFRLKSLQDETDATNLSTQYISDLSTLKADYYSKSGQAAYDAAPKYSQDLMGLRDNYLALAANPTIKEHLAADIAKQTNYALIELGQHVPQQMKIASTQASTGRLDMAANAAVGVRNDPAQVSEYFARGVSEWRKLGEINDWPPEYTQAKATEYLGQGYEKVIGTLAQEDPARASAMFAQVRPLLDATSQERIAQQLQPKLVASKLQAGLPAVFGGAALGQDGLQNNVFGLRPSSAQWEGKGQPLITARGPFETFTTPQQGAAAGIANLQYQYSKLPPEQQNIGGLIAKLTPPNDPYGKNNTTAYAQTVAAAAGLKVTDPVPFGNPQQLLPFVKQIIGNEGMAGGKKLTDQDINDAINTAAGKGAKAVTQSFPDLDDMLSRGRSYVASDPTLAADPTAGEKMDSLVARQYHELEAATASQRAAFSKTYRDTAAALANGDPKAAIPEQQIRSLYPVAQADQMVDALKEEQSFGQINSQVKVAAAADLPALRARLDPGNDPTVEGYAVRQKQLAQFDRAVNVRNTQITNDPATYAYNLPTVAAAYKNWQANPGDPAATQAYVAETITQQQRLGVPTGSTHILPNDLAANMVQKLETLDPTQGSVTTQLNEYKKQFGPYYNDVLHDLGANGLRQEYALMGDMTGKGQGTVQADAQRMLSIMSGPKPGGKAIEEMAGPKNIKDVDGALDGGLMDDFNSTTTLQGSGVEYAANMRNLVRNLALYYVATKQAPDGATAAAKAVDGVINQRFSITDGVRAPAGQEDIYRAAAKQYVQNLTADDVGGSYAPRAFLQDIDKQSMLLAAQRGKFITNGKNDGVILMGALKNGAYIPLRGKDGNYLGFNFLRDMQTLATAQAAANPVDTIGGATPGQGSYK